MALSTARGAPIGLFFGPAAVVAVCGRAVGNRVEIVSASSIETPLGALEGVDILDPVRLGHAVRQLWRRMGLRSTSATVAVPHPSYSMRALRLPDVPVSERRRLVRGELEQSAVIPLGGGAFDFIWLPGSTGAAGRQANVCAYYTSDAFVDAVQTTMRHAGLRLGCLEPLSLAVMRAYLMGRPQNEPVALFLPMEKHSDLCIHDGRNIRQLRRIPAGADDLPARDESGAPSSTFNLETGELELPEESGGVGIPGLQTARKGDFIITEVARSLAFYAREHPEAARPRSLAVIGPPNVGRDFERLLADTQPIPVEYVDALSALGISDHQVAGSPFHFMARLSAAGAAATGAGVEVGLPRVDISQQEAAAEKRRRAPSLLLAGMAGSTAWLVLSAFAAIGLTYLESRGQDESARLTREITAIKEERARTLRYQERLAAAGQLEASAKVPVDAVLGRVAAAARPGISLTSIKIGNDGKVVLEGKASDTRSIQRFNVDVGSGASVILPVIQMVRRDQFGSLDFRIVGRCPKASEPAEKATSQE